MAKYFILTGLTVNPEGAPTVEMIFGDYERAIVADELQDIKHNCGYQCLRIYAVPMDTQLEIDIKLEELQGATNAGWEYGKQVARRTA